MKIEWVEGFKISVKYFNKEVTVSANREGLLSLACQLEALAAGRPGDHIHYDAYTSLEEGSSALIIEKAEQPGMAETDGLNESELYKELGILTKDRNRWKERIPYVSSLLVHESIKIQGKALWLLGEMGLVYPQSVQAAVPAIAAFLCSSEPFLRERAVNALGRIGRADYSLIEPYWAELFRFASDEEAKVRLSFIWASENIASSTPDIYKRCMPVFEKLLHDADDKVRMEAPEIVRVLGKRRPEFVRPYVEQLQKISETDDNPVVRIHCLGAIKAAGSM